MSQASRQRVHRNAQYYDDPGSIVTSEIASAESKRFSKASAATTTTTSSSIVSYPLTASQGDVSGGIGQGGSSYSNNGNRMGTSRRNSNSGMSSSAAAAASVNAASSMPSAGTTPPPPPHPASLNATKSSSNVAKDIKKMFTGRGK